jgi:hypothetical protein
MDDWYWHFLGLKPGASHDEIEHAHRRLAKLLHPDHGGTNEDMQRLNEAYELAKKAPPSKTESPPTAEPPTATESPPKTRSHARKPREPFFVHKPREPVLTKGGRYAVYSVIVAIVLLGAFASLSDNKQTWIWPKDSRAVQNAMMIDACLAMRSYARNPNAIVVVPYPLDASRALVCDLSNIDHWHVEGSLPTGYAPCEWTQDKCMPMSSPVSQGTDWCVTRYANLFAECQNAAAQH